MTTQKKMFPLEPEMGICHVSLPPKHCDGEWRAEINQVWLRASKQRGLVEGAAACALRPVH